MIQIGSIMMQSWENLVLKLAPYWCKSCRLVFSSNIGIPSSALILISSAWLGSENVSSNPSLISMYVLCKKIKIKETRNWKKAFNYLIEKKDIKNLIFKHFFVHRTALFLWHIKSNKIIKRWSKMLFEWLFFFFLIHEAIWVRKARKFMKKLQIKM